VTGTWIRLVGSTTAAVAGLAAVRTAYREPAVDHHR
jgi:hypothetical protein